MNIKKNNLHYYIDLLRMDDIKQRTPKESGICVTALNNVIRTMKLSRHNKICGEDFSRLDFGNIPFNGIHWSLNGKYPSCFDGCKLNELNFISGHTSDITDVSWSPDGKYILTKDSLDMIILWDSGSGLLISMIPEDGDLPDNLSSEERSLIEKFRAKTGKEDGSVDNGKYRLTWSLDTKNAELCDTKTKKSLTLSGHSKPVCSGGFSPDGRYCLTGSYDKTARIWDTETGECLKSLSGHSIFNQAVIRSDGKYCITNSTDGHLKMWKLEAGKRKCIWQKEKFTVSINKILEPVESYIPYFNDSFRMALRYLMAKEESICSAAFSLDGKHCMIGLAGGTLNEFDIETGELTSKKKTNKGSVPSVVYSPDGTYSITDSDQGNATHPEIKSENLLEFINTLYNADGMHITNCSFKDITADDTTKEIIYQYGETRYISADETTAL